MFELGAVRVFAVGGVDLRQSLFETGSGVHMLGFLRHARGRR